MLPELMHTTDLEVLRNATNGVYHIIQTFSNPIYVVLYLVWLFALWFHLTHGFWSALQTLGWSNNKWQKRTKVIGIVIVTLIMGGFAITAIIACLKANGIM